MQFLAVLAGGAGLAAYLWLKQKWDERGNRQLDHYLDTRTYASEPDADGFRTVIIRNIGSTERVETVVRGRKERGWLIAAAHRCNWTHRFIKDPDAHRQGRILHVVRNAVTRHWAAGEAADAVGLPVAKKDLFYSPTGADAAQDGVRMIRNMIVDEETMKVFLEHPVDKWRSEGDLGVIQDHSVRVTTIRDMADAYFNHDGMKQMEDGTWVRIVGWFEAKYPLTVSVDAHDRRSDRGVELMAA